MYKVPVFGLLKRGGSVYSPDALKVIEQYLDEYFPSESHFIQLPQNPERKLGDGYSEKSAHEIGR